MPPTCCPKKELALACAATCSSAPAGPARLPPCPSLHRAVPVKFFHLVPAKSPKAEPSLRSPFMSGRLYCLASTESKSCLSSATSASAIPAVRQIREARVADHVARVARDHEAARVPLVRGQGQLRGEALGLRQRLVVDHDELALVRPTVPLQEDPRALVAQQPQLRAAVWGRAVVGHLQLAPARPVLRQEEIVREVGGVGHGERVGGEELRRGDRAQPRHVAAHHAARRHSAARGREGAVQALAVQRARGGRAGDCQRGARERPGGCEARRRRCARGRQRARGHVA